MTRDMLTVLVEKLNHCGLNGWQIRETRKSSFQSFLAKVERESSRTTETTQYDVTIYKKQPAIKNGGGVGKERNLGFSSFNFSPCESERIEKLLEEALYAASLVRNESFELPEKVVGYPQIEIFDESLTDKSLRALEDRIISAVEKEKHCRLSSAEFFIDTIETILLNHKGLEAHQKESVIHTEFILLAQSGKKENEFINRTSRRLLKDLKLEEEIKESAEYARQATRAKPPKTGTSPVLLSDEPLDQLFNPLLARVSARVKYNKMLEVEIGKSVCEGGEAEGDAITLWSNGLLKGGLGTNQFDSYGTPTNKTLLIQNNRVIQLLADKRYADYLNVPTTGELGNIEIEPGKKTMSELIALALSKYPTVLHVSAFSAFEPNPITGSFSAEIRTGWEISKKEIRPIKGGSISGVLTTDLKQCYLSKELIQRERIYCPKAILFDHLTVAGS